MTSFTLIYYITTIGAIICVPLIDLSREKNLWKGFRAWVWISVSAIYLFGMLRSEGVDVANYRYIYEVDYTSGFTELGFGLLIDAFNALGLPWEALQFFTGLVGLLAISRLAKHFGCSKSLLLLLFFLHLIVVRDFAQMRVGFAVSLAAIGLTLPWRWRWLFYCAAVSMHLTVAPFIIAYESCIYTAGIRSKYTRFFVVFLGLGLVFAAGFNLSVFSFIDPRVELYMAWQKEGYGMPVSSHGLLIIHGLLIFGLWIIRARWTENVQIRALFYLEMVGVTSFLALSHQAIFCVSHFKCDIESLSGSFLVGN